MIGRDPKVRTGERGIVLIMGTVVAVTQVLIAEREQVLTMFGGLAGVQIGRKGVVPIGGKGGVQLGRKEGVPIGRKEGVPIGRKGMLGVIMS